MQFIKGRIDFNQTIKENAFRKHLHFVSYEEFSLNNLLNRIIKTTMLRLLSNTKIAYNKKALKLALIYLEEIEPIKLHPGIFDQVRFNRLNQNYRRPKCIIHKEPIELQASLEEVLKDENPSSKDCLVAEM